MRLPASERTGPENAHAFVAELLGEDVHATRVMSLANGVVGVLRAAALGIHAIGRGLADALDLAPKHAIKQVDRLLSNAGITIWDWFDQWVTYVVGDRKEQGDPRGARLDRVRQGWPLDDRPLPRELSRPSDAARVEDRRQVEAERPPRRVGALRGQPAARGPEPPRRHHGRRGPPSATSTCSRTSPRSGGRTRSAASRTSR